MVEKRFADIGGTAGRTDSERRRAARFPGRELAWPLRAAGGGGFTGSPVQFAPDFLTTSTQRVTSLATSLVMYSLPRLSRGGTAPACACPTPRRTPSMKARMGATHFLTKTLPKVAAEMALSVLAYNLTRVMNIIGIKPLIAAIRA